MKALVLLTLLACATVNGQPKPIPVTVPEGTFEFSKLSIFHVSTSSGKQVANLIGTVDNNTHRPWLYTRFRLVATGHSPEAPQKRIVKEIEFNIAGLESGGPIEFRYPLDPMPYFEVDSFRVTWLEGKASSKATINEHHDAEAIADYTRTHRFITYEVGGSTYSARITYATGDGGVQQKEVSVPWHETVSVEPGAVLSISAQNKQDSGTVRVKILERSLVLKDAVSEGAYVIASTTTRIQ